jgi:L-threonylcarbamoyladenylate synthase
VARAAAALRRGHLVIYPTETLYALGGLGLSGEAAARVRRAKGRARAHPLPLVAADLSQLLELAASWPREAERLASRFWPGPLTLVVSASSRVPEEVTAGTGTVAVRVPGRSVTRRLCAAAGPLISTSANRSGGPPASTCAEAVAAVGRAAALALDGGAASGPASTIVDVSGTRPRLLREGALRWREVSAFLLNGGC